MQLFEAARTAQVRADIERQEFAIVRDVILPTRHFEAPRGSADILLRQLDDHSGCILLIEEGVHYKNDDAELLEYFSHGVRSGWRPLTVLRPADPAAVLRQADIVLGLSGTAPRGPAHSRSREMSVPVSEIDSGLGRDTERFGTDLVEEARCGRLAPALFREREIAAAMRILSKQGKNAVCLVGEAGVGKTAVVEQLAIEVAQGNTPPALRDIQILEVNLSFIAAGAVHQNEFEGRLKQILDRARSDPRVILFFDEVHTICRPGSDASQLIKSDLGRGRIRCLGATTTTEFREIEADPALARRFQVVRVAELSFEQALVILERCREKLQIHHRVEIPPELIAEAVDLSMRYAPLRHLPDKAIDLLDEACACARLAGWARKPREEEQPMNARKETQIQVPLVDSGHLRAVISAWTGIPVERIQGGHLDAEIFDRLRERLASRIFGQEAAVEAAVAALERRHSLPCASAEKRPVWTALFAGPTGVGKTLMAGATSEEFFREESALCTIHCSELTQEHHIARLIGAPPGYVGYGRPGQLVSALERRASGVLLFDEVEKAHPQILTAILLPLLGEGVVHDMSTGRELNATHWIVILTSNVGASGPHERNVGFSNVDRKDPKPQQDAIRSGVEEYFPRELLGRTDDILIFRALNRDAVNRIWDRETRSFQTRLQRRGEPIRLEILDAARDLLLAHANPAVQGQGARALIRLFSTAVVDSCLALLTEPVLVPSVLRIEAADQSLRYRLLPEPEPPASVQE